MSGSLVIPSNARDLLLTRWPALLAFVATAVFSATDVPYLSGRVVDNAEIL